MAKVYFLLEDNEDAGTVKLKMVADPPRSEWLEDEFTPAQQLALAAYAGMLDAGKVVRPDEPPEPEQTVVRSWDVGNN